MRLELGVTVSDVLSGFSGIVSGRCEYLTGCDTYLVHPGGLDKEKGTPREGKWFDDARLKLNPNVKRIALVVTFGGKTLVEATPGGPSDDMPAPMVK